MKKAVSILLAAVLLACSGSAFAGRLEYRPESGNPAGFSLFAEYFSGISARMGVPFSRGSEPYTDSGYEVYEFWADVPLDDGSADMSVYTLKGNTEYLVIDGAMYAEAEGGMELLFAMVKATYLAGVSALYFAENGQGGAEANQKAADAVAAGWQELVRGLSAEMKKPDEWLYTCVTTVLGYPTGAEMYLDGSTIVMTVYVMNRNSGLWEE